MPAEVVERGVDSCEGFFEAVYLVLKLAQLVGVLALVFLWSKSADPSVIHGRNKRGLRIAQSMS